MRGPGATALALAMALGLVPWDTVCEQWELEAMGSLLERSPNFQEYMVDLVSRNYERLGWQDNGTQRKLIVSTLLVLQIHV